MREHFHEELDRLRGELVEGARLVDTAIGRATTALLESDLAVAEEVIEADKTLDALHRRLDDHAVELIARQQPVATDLRIIVASLRISADLERMGDLACHIAELALRRYPGSSVPPELRATFVQMGETAQRVAAKAGNGIAAMDIRTAAALEHDDDQMDELHRALYERLQHPSWSHGVQSAVDLALAGRYYERFADHAVSIGRRVAYLAGNRTV